MALLSLPTELLDMIILETMPEGFGPLSLSCKTLFRQCEPFIEHHLYLRWRYSIFRYETYHAEQDDDVWTAFDLLARIATEPVIARYIQRADFRWDSDYIDKRRHPNLKADIGDVDYGGKVAKLLAQSRYIQEAGLDWEEYWAQVKKELTDPTPPLGDVNFSQHAAAVVLTLLPNVKTVMLPCYWIRDDTTNRLLHAIYNKAMQPHASGSCSLGHCTRISGHTGKMESMWFVPFENLPHALSQYVPRVSAFQSMP